MEVSKAALSCLNPLIYAQHVRTTRNFYAELQYLPNVLFPHRYNEKMYWRKVFDHNPAFGRFCDKVASKDIFRSLSTPVATPETLWSGTDPSAFPETLMRNDVVAKHSAGSGRNWFFSERGSDRSEFETVTWKWLGRCYGTAKFEWGYTAAASTILAEPVLEQDPAKRQDIKVQVVGGRVYYAMIYTAEKTGDSRSAIFSECGERLRVTNSITPIRPSHALPADYRVPDCFADAMKAAREIGRDLDYIRVDFLVADGKLYGGELSPYPSAGLMTNSDQAVLQDLADNWPLERSWFVRTPQTGLLEFYRQRLLAHLARKADDPRLPLQSA